MSAQQNDQLTPALVRERATSIYRELQNKLFKDTDKLFAYLLIAEWLFGVVCAFVISPQRWEGATSSTHIHVWAAIFLGGSLTFFPVLLVWQYPGKAVTRHTIAFSQMMFSALLIHLSGGRIETHFHIFGSLAFLAFYRDWKIFITATVVVAVDHFVRGMYWPQSVYGTMVASNWRWLEHSGWVVFEDVFLIFSCIRGCRELRGISTRQAELEATNMTLDYRTQDLARSNQELEQFAQIAAHDLQSPLRSVATNCQMLEESCETLNSEQKEYARGAMDGVRTMRTTINDILEYSKLGKRDGVYEPVSLEDVLESVLYNLREFIAEKKAVITRDSLPTLNGNRSQITRLLQNLVENAVKFCEQSQPRIHLSAKKNGADWTVAIRDNGIGIDRKHYSHIFEMFRRLHTQEEYPGTGVGLSACKKIVEMHRGKIWVESVIGKGSTFYFTFGQRTSFPASARSEKDEKDFRLH